ncbi:tRNA preQ1(34) S-adenosylmethionine ribosyltransferase-isomerase QueA [Ruminococcaceae bacterium OttesenSCG-928-L11]|nr:tRNA preQ1(34) S-adenosylmethionine ribosyltransferase-isomerase QueA [Ruminococcaceae bacterium OttesenSCG-928-L11]
MKRTDFYYDLPEELIAQHPLERRDGSRLLCLGRMDGQIAHRHFFDLPDLLRPGDLLVMNDSRVIPARLIGRKIPTGAQMEFLLLEQRDGDVWEILVRPGRKAPPGSRFSFGDGLLEGEILEVLDGGNRLARFYYEGSFFAVLDTIGAMPLPPYITEKLADKERYQTVYSRENGSAAAPTAGLHFTPELLDKVAKQGVDTAFVTLHVGLGTFRPVKADEITDHKMHAEHYTVSPETADRINRTKQAGGRVIAVGTTSCRTLESVMRDHGEIRACSGSTDIFIYPGYTFGVLDGLITNFHLPESTLIMLVSAFAGYDSTMEAYREAVEERYRFFSFGDSMLIL